MKLIEADAKQMLSDHGLPTPSGRRLLHGDDELPSRLGGAAIKAQILAGGRGKTGLVQLATGANIPGALASVRHEMATAGHTPLIMVEDMVDIDHEYFLAWRIDDVMRAPVLMFSSQGGVEVESNAQLLKQEVFDPLTRPRLAAISRFLKDSGLAGRNLAAVSRVALDLHDVLEREDAILIEINPLVITGKGSVVAVDAKITLDENADRRHRERQALTSARLQIESSDPIETAAAEAGITFVKLDGQVALLTGGAGLGMTLVDLLADAGYAAANFVDVPGGSGSEIFGTLTRLVLRRAEDEEVKAILMFLTLSATSLKQPVESILQVLDELSPAKPFVVGLVAGGSAEREMTLDQAHAAFEARGHRCVTDLDAAVAAVVAAISL